MGPEQVLESRNQLHLPEICQEYWERSLCNAQVPILQRGSEEPHSKGKSISISNGPEPARLLQGFPAAET